MIRYIRHPHDEEDFTCPCGQEYEWGRKHYIACHCGCVNWKGGIRIDPPTTERVPEDNTAVR